MGGLIIFMCGVIALVIKLTSKQNIENEDKYLPKKAEKHTKYVAYNKDGDYEKQAMSYYNEGTYLSYKKALDLFSKAIISSTEVKHYLYYYRANTQLKLNILQNALEDINTALKYIDDNDTGNITKYLYTKGLIIQKTGSDEDIIDFWKYLISFSKYKCNDCGKIRNKNLSYCTCGSRNFTVIDNEYINNAKMMLENVEAKSIKNYMQNIHDIIFNKHFILKQSIYNVFSAIYAKKKLEVAEENYELGLQEFYTENLDKAKEYFEYALSLAPYNKEYKECLKQIKKEENKTIADEKVMLGVTELNNGNANKAIQYFDDALNIYESAKTFFLRGKAFLTQGNITLCEKAIYNFKKAISLEAENSEYYFYCGKAHFERYNYNEALECFNNTINLKNDNWEYYYQRGLTNNEVGNYADSIEDYSKAISLNCEILQNEDILYDIQDSVNKVESISSNSEKVKHIKALMTEGNEYVEIGCDYLNKNNFNTAIEYFNKAIEINPNYKYGYFNRATAYAKLEDYQNAINDYNKVIDLDVNWADAYRFRGLTYYNMNLYNEAISDFNTLIKFNILDAQAYYLRGSTYYLMDNMKSMAIKDFASASLIDASYVNRISEETNINLMQVMDTLEKLSYLSEEETINAIYLIQGMTDEDLGHQEHSQNNELSSDNLSIIKSSIRKIDL